MTGPYDQPGITNLPGTPGAGGVCGKHGVYVGHGCPTCAVVRAALSAPAGRTPYRCPVCGGRGTMPHDFYTRLGASNATGPVQCRSCGGSGIVYA